MATAAPAVPAVVEEPVLKAYNNAVPNSTFIMPDGRILRFSGNTYHTNKPDEIEQLDKIVDMCGISTGVALKPSEQTDVLAKAAAALQLKAAEAQKAEQDALLKAAGSVVG